MTAVVVVLATLLIALGLLATTTRRVVRSRAVAAASTGAAVLLAGLGNATVAPTPLQPSIVEALAPVAIGAAAIAIVGLRRPTVAAAFGALLAGPACVLFDDPFRDPACTTACDINPLAIWPQPETAVVLRFLGYALLTVGLISNAPIRGRGIWTVVLGLLAGALWSGASADWVTVAALLACVVFATDLGKALGRHARLTAVIEAMAWEGDAEAALTRIDPTITVAYRVDGMSTLVDRHGSSVPYSDSGMDVVGPAGLIAQLHHRGPAGSIRAIGELIRGPARLGLENLRLAAESAVRAGEIAASTRRLVATADAERRRLERDLHDGAQQGLVTLGLQLRVGTIATDLDDSTVDRLVADLQSIAAEVRGIAHGIHAASLHDDGLLHALRLLAHRTPVPLSVVTAPDRPISPILAAAAYAAIEDQCMVAGGPVDVSVVELDGGIRTTMTIDDTALRAGSMSLERSADRFRALGGALQVETTATGTRITGFLPGQRT